MSCGCFICQAISTLTIHRLERKLNFPRNLAVGDKSFAQKATILTEDYEELCIAQYQSHFAQRRSGSLPTTDETIYIQDQAQAALQQAGQSSQDIRTRVSNNKLLDEIEYHSNKEPDSGTSDAVLVIPCSGATTEIIECIHGGEERNKFLQTFILVHGKPDKRVVTPIPPSYHHGTRADSADQLTACSVESESQKQKGRKGWLQSLYLVHPECRKATDKPSEDKSFPQASGQDLLLPVMLTEYKKKDTSTIGKAMNQMKTYLVSALRFLDALSITEQPVFGLIVNGRLGAVTMAWQKNEVRPLLFRLLPKAHEKIRKFTLWSVMYGTTISPTPCRHSNSCLCCFAWPGMGWSFTRVLSRRRAKPITKASSFHGGLNQRRLKMVSCAMERRNFATG